MWKEMSHWIYLVQGKDGTGEPQLITLWETFLSKIKRVFHGFCKHSVGQNSATWSYNCKRSWEMYSSCVPKRNEGNRFGGNSQLSLPMDIKQRLKLVWGAGLPNSLSSSLICSFACPIYSSASLVKKAERGKWSSGHYPKCCLGFKVPLANNLACGSQCDQCCNCLLSFNPSSKRIIPWHDHPHTVDKKMRCHKLAQ